MAVFGATGVAATAASATPAGTHAASTGVAPSGDNGTTIDPLQYNCGNDAPTCGQVGESYGYYNGTNVDLLYSENYYCDPSVASQDTTTGCEAGAPASANPTGTSADGTSLGNTSHGDTLYIPTPVGFTPSQGTQCVGTATCIDHPPTADLSALASYLGVANAASLDSAAIPGHDHVVSTRNGGLPEWWNVQVVATKDAATFNTLSSASAIQAAETAGTATAVQTNIFLFFQVLPGTVPAAQAANLTATAPPGPAIGATAADPPASQAETGTTFNNLKNDCGASTGLCQNLGVTHGWVSATPGAEGQDIESLYSESGYCSGTSGCEAGSPATTLPPGVGGNGVIPTAANSYPGSTQTGNDQIDPLYIPVPLGFTPDYTQCPTAITCIDHPQTINLSAIAKYLPGDPSPASVSNVALPSHDHVLTTRNGDQPEWWNVEVVPVTSQAQLTAIENNKDLSLAQEEPFDPTTNPGGAIDTNAYLWFQTLPGASSPTPGPVQPTACQSTLPSGSVVSATALPDGTGYIETDAKGDVAVFGAATCYGSLTGRTLNQPIVGIAADRTTGGYWLTAADGGVFAFNAPYYGSTGNLKLNKPVVGIATDINSQGYYLVASDGGIFAYNEPFQGSTGSLKLNKPVVGMSVDRATGGYWLVASDGGVFAYDAPFEGSTGSLTLNKPVTAMASSSDGSGYNLFAADGGVFSYNSPFQGSLGSTAINKPIIAGAQDNSTDGYWMFGSDGGVFNYGAPFYGSAA